MLPTALPQLGRRSITAPSGMWESRARFQHAHQRSGPTPANLAGVLSLPQGIGYCRREIDSRNG